MIFNREPAIWAAAIAAVIQGVMIFVHKDTAANLAGAELWLTPAVTMLAGLITRHKSVSTATIKDAGLSPRAVKARAADPDVQPHEGP